MIARPALASAGSVLLFACGAPAAWADVAPLPPAGTTIALIEDGDMVLECDGVVHRFDLHGTGQLRVGDTIAGDTPTTVVTTDAEDLVGFDPVSGQVSVTERAPAAGAFVAASAGKPFPAAESIAQDLTVSFEHSPCGTGQPGTFATKAEFPILNTNLQAFPPANTVYQSAETVELVDVRDPNGPAPVVLTAFPLTVSQVAA